MTPAINTTGQGFGKRRLSPTFDDEMTLYRELYPLDVIESQMTVTQEYFDYCKAEKHFIVLLLYDNDGRVYLAESDVNQFALLGGAVLKNESVRDAVKRILGTKFNNLMIEELEPIAFSKNVFSCEGQSITHNGLAVMLRVDIGNNDQLRKNFYHISESILRQINKFSDKRIVELFIERFANIVLYNNHEFQDEEISTNKKYNTRYKIHNSIVKRFLLTDRIKRKDELIRLMSEKVKGYSRFLDISCGDNSLLFSLKYDKNFEFIVANDISWSQIEFIQPRPDLYFTNHNALTFPFKDDAFDFVFCSNTLHHMPSMECLVSLLNSLIRVGKKVVIYEIEDPEITGGFPLALNKYWYRGFLKDAGEQYLSAKLFKTTITRCLAGKAKIKFSHFRNIQGNYMIAEIEKV